jgi:hypothetical protein
LNNIFGHNHPYSKSRGNVLFTMLAAYTLDLTLIQGLWCETSFSCHYNTGGMFITTTVRAALFDGFYDPSIVKYLNRKHKNDGIRFECYDSAYDQCGIQSYQCSDAGLVLFYGSGHSFRLQRFITPKDKFFSEFFEITTDGEMLWPDVNSALLVARAQEARKQNKTIIRVRNPYWAAYPAWNSNDTDWNKFYQCQYRTMSGPTGLFPSCVDTLNTGRRNVKQVMNIEKLNGNATVLHVPKNPAAPVTGSAQNGQFPMYSWSGFLKYPYIFEALLAGPKYEALTNPTLFHRPHAIKMELSQSTITDVTERVVLLAIPPKLAFEDNRNISKSLVLQTRRFVEDGTTWDNIRTLSVPKDSYGMNYTTPKGMASLESLTGFPVFVGSANSYLNAKLGGLEYLQVTGVQRNEYAQRMYVDYDPVTGRSLRSAVRQQVQYINCCSQMRK